MIPIEVVQNVSGVHCNDVGVNVEYNQDKGGNNCYAELNAKIKAKEPLTDDDVMKLLGCSSRGM